MTKSKNNIRQQQQVAINFSEQSSQTSTGCWHDIVKRFTCIKIFFFFTDYILAYEVDNDKDAEWQRKREEKRREFEANLEKANLELEAEGIEVRVHVTCTLYNNPYIL